jgi:hypothetical protein
MANVSTLTCWICGKALSQKWRPAHELERPETCVGETLQNKPARNPTPENCLLWLSSFVML